MEMILNSNRSTHKETPRLKFVLLSIIILKISNVYQIIPFKCQQNCLDDGLPWVLPFALSLKIHTTSGRARSSRHTFDPTVNFKIIELINLTFVYKNI